MENNTAVQEAVETVVTEVAQEAVPEVAKTIDWKKVFIGGAVIAAGLYIGHRYYEKKIKPKKAAKKVEKAIETVEDKVEEVVETVEEAVNPEGLN